MDLRQSRHGCAKIKRGPEGPRRLCLIAILDGLVNRPGGPKAAYFFSIAVSLTDVEPVETGAPAAAGGFCPA